MFFYLELEFRTPLSDGECQERIVRSVREELAKEQLGEVLGAECLDLDQPPGSERTWSLAIQVSDSKRAREVLIRLLQSDDRE